MCDLLWSDPVCVCVCLFVTFRIAAAVRNRYLVRRHRVPLCVVCVRALIHRRLCCSDRESNQCVVGAARCRPLLTSAPRTRARQRRDCRSRRHGSERRVRRGVAPNRRATAGSTSLAAPTAWTTNVGLNIKFLAIDPTGARRSSSVAVGAACETGAVFRVGRHVSLRRARHHGRSH